MITVFFCGGEDSVSGFYYLWMECKAREGKAEGGTKGILKTVLCLGCNCVVYKMIVLLILVL